MQRIALPKPRFKGGISVAEALSSRRTTRRFDSEKIDLPTISQLLWALQGITFEEDSPTGQKIQHRTAPSAGRTYPLEITVALSTGLYRYDPESHHLDMTQKEDVRDKLSEAAISPLNREAIRKAPITVILAADNRRSLKATPLFENASRFVHLEAGHATQNLILQARHYGLGVCTITSYDVGNVYKALRLPLDKRPIYILPIGFPKK